MDSKPPESPPAPADLATFRDFRQDLVAYQRSSPGEVRQAMAAAARWHGVLPALRYFGELPCFRADCPACGAALGLWVTVACGAGGWYCGACQASGLDPDSLAAFVAEASAG